MAMLKEYGTCRVSRGALEDVVLDLMPLQGRWSEEAYIGLTDSAKRLIEKRGDYAEAGIPEYWIVNPESETITVLRLEGEAYVECGVYGRGLDAESALLSGFTVGVDAVFDAD